MTPRAAARRCISLRARATPSCSESCSRVPPWTLSSALLTPTAERLSTMLRRHMPCTLSCTLSCTLPCAYRALGMPLPCVCHMRAPCTMRVPHACTELAMSACAVRPARGDAAAARPRCRRQRQGPRGRRAALRGLRCWQERCPAAARCPRRSRLDFAPRADGARCRGASRLRRTYSRLRP